MLHGSLITSYTHTAMPQIRHWLQGTNPYPPQKLPLPMGRLPPPSTLHILEPTQLTLPHSIQTPLAVFTQFTGQTDTETNRKIVHGKRPVAIFRICSSDVAR